MYRRSFFTKLFAVVLMLAMLMSAIPVNSVTVVPDLSYRFYMVGNSHIDTAWRWPIQHTADEVIRATFDRQVGALKTNSTYRFTSSCSIHYVWSKEYYPQQYADIKAMVTGFNEDGTPKNPAWGEWGIAGGQVVEPDLNVMEGETFARQGLYAQHFFLEEFGRIAYVGLVPDVFGFSGQFPQFLRKTGMTSYVATKMNWSSDPGDGAMDPGPWSQNAGGSANTDGGNAGANSKGRESDIFWWEAIDGTDVLAYNCKNDYTNSYGTGDFQGNGVDTVFNRISRSGSLTNNATLTIGGVTYNNPYTGTYYYDYDSNLKYALGMFGSGDHGGGPNSGTGSNNHGWSTANSGSATTTNRAIALPGTLDDFFAAVRIPGVGTPGNVDGANRDASLLGTDGTSLGRVYRHVGENYLSYHRGTYTSWSRVKKDNRQLNNLSQSAEQAATLGFWTKSLENNGNEKIQQSWERIALNTMHDILPGSSGPIQYYQTFMNNELNRNLLTNIMNNSLSALAYRADTSVTDGVPVFVYNPMSWVRDGSTTTTVTLNRQYPYIRAFDGADEIPATLISSNADGVAEISFLAKGVPSLGYKVFRVVGSDTPSTIAKAVNVTEDATSFVVENENLRFTISKTTGNIPSLINKKDGNREVFYQTDAFQGNALQFKVDTGGSSYPAWDMTMAEFGGVSQAWNTVDAVAEVPTVVVDTAERVTIKVVQRFTDSSNLTPSIATRYITLVAGSDKIDVNFDLDFQMQQRNLKVAFPINVNARGSSYEIAYGAMDGAVEVKRMDEPIPPTTAATPLMNNYLSGVPSYAGALGRSTLRNTRFNVARFEQSGHKWMDISDDTGSHGMSILNDAKYGHDVLRMVRTENAANGMGTDPSIVGDETYVRARLTVVRSPRSAANDYQRPNTQVPNPTTQTIDIGEQDFNYSIYPHAGTWQVGNTSIKAHDLNFPLVSFQATPGAGDGILGRSRSFFSLNKDNVVIGAVKNQHDEQDNENKIIVRVWETNGANTSGVTLTLPSNVTAAREVNMLEHAYNELSDDNIDNPVSKKLEAKTIAISGNTATFDIGKYEILTMEFVIAPYAGTAIELTQEKVNLASYFNTRGTSPDADPSLGNLDGNGNTIPEPLWKDAREAEVDFMGIKFQLGPDAAENFVTAASQTIAVGAAGYNKVYLLGAAGKVGDAKGTFIVNYSDGSSVEKEITFADWRSPLTGWVPMDQMDSAPYVYDSIAQVFTHWHLPASVAIGSYRTHDMMTIDNYLYAYYINVDAAKTIASITLPDASGIKVAGISLTNSVIPGFGDTSENIRVPAEEFDWAFEDLAVGQPMGTRVGTSQNIQGEATYTGTPRNFASIVSSGHGNNADTGEQAGRIQHTGQNKFCQNINAGTAWFVMDAGENIRRDAYIIRGANDDMSYLSRVLDGWIVQGSDNATSGWVTIATERGNGGGWTSNYQYRTFLFDWPSDAPADGYRYYRLQVTHAGSGGTELTGSYMIQFSYFGLANAFGFATNGALSIDVDEGVEAVPGKMSFTNMNGLNTIVVSGQVATDGTPDVNGKVSVRGYSSLKSRKPLNVKVYSDTKISYMVFPKDEVSKYVAVDLTFDDGTRLTDVVASKALVPGKWNYVEVDVGKYAADKNINGVIVGLVASAADPGDMFEAVLDSVSIYRYDGKIDLSKMFNIRLVNDTSFAGSVNVYAAVYTADNRLSSIEVTNPISVAANSTVVINPEIVLDSAGANSNVKLFIWDTDYMPRIDEFEFVVN